MRYYSVNAKTLLNAKYKGRFFTIFEFSAKKRFYDLEIRFFEKTMDK